MRKAIKIASFVVALGASAGLVAAAANGTGAYFTDSHSGTINASTGSVKVNTTDLTLNFSGLLPDQFQTDPIQFQSTGSGPEDIWMVFDPTTSAILNGPGGTDAPLGRFGHFALTSPAGNFSSFNLSSEGAAPPHTGNSCSVDQNGHGGSTTEAADKTTLVDFCPVPQEILLASNVAPGNGGEADVTFGYTRLLTGPQNAPLGQVAPYSIIATQPGILPSNVNN
jgi:hypothetical protein